MSIIVFFVVFMFIVVVIARLSYLEEQKKLILKILPLISTIAQQKTMYEMFLHEEILHNLDVRADKSSVLIYLRANQEKLDSLMKDLK